MVRVGTSKKNSEIATDVNDIMEVAQLCYPTAREQFAIGNV